MKTQDAVLDKPTRTTPSSRQTPAPLHDLPSGDGAAVDPPAVDPPSVEGAAQPPERKAPRGSRRPVKAKGADLKVQYHTTLLLGFALSLGLLVGLTYIDFRASTAENSVTLEQQEVVEMQEIQQTEQIERAPLPPRPTTPVEVPNDEVIEDEPLNLDASLDLNASLDVPSTPPPAPEAAPEEENEDEQGFFVIVEEKPELIGGTQAIYEKMRYPSVLRAAGVEGRVIVQFIVDENGNVVDPTVLQSPHSMLSKEALRALQLVKFKPGRQRSQPVRVQMALPIIFRLEDSALQ